MSEITQHEVYVMASGNVADEHGTLIGTVLELLLYPDLLSLRADGTYMGNGIKINFYKEGQSASITTGDAKPSTYLRNQKELYAAANYLAVLAPDSSIGHCKLLMDALLGKDSPKMVITVRHEGENYTLCEDGVSQLSACFVKKNDKCIELLSFEEATAFAKEKLQRLYRTQITSEFDGNAFDAWVQSMAAVYDIEPSPSIYVKLFNAYKEDVYI